MGSSEMVKFLFLKKDYSGIILRNIGSTEMVKFQFLKKDYSGGTLRNMVLTEMVKFNFFGKRLLRRNSQKHGINWNG